SWDRDATLLAVKSGDTWNHAHADAGSFILFHAGRPLLIDAGSCSYGRPEYRGYYARSTAHNVVLFNGEGQPEEDFHRGAKFPGHLHELLDGHGVKYLYADSTGPMARYLTRNYRHWLWVDGVILVFDDLRSHEAGRFDWLLHYAGEARRTGTDIDLTNGPARAWVRMLHPENPVVSEKEGLEEKRPERKLTYLALSSPTPVREQRFVVAIVPQPAGGIPAPEVELVRLPEALGVRVRSARQITEVYVNLLADGRQRGCLDSTNTIAGWGTDASLFAVTRPASSEPMDVGQVTRYFVADGSYLRRDGQVVLHAFSKISAVIKPGAAAEIQLQGQRHVEATLLALQAPGTLHVNGQPTSFDHQPAARTLRFRHRST
ncbi:MAG: heparinase II/III domain-containing protein, partial [Opitutaceae bacterium]